MCITCVIRVTRVILITQVPRLLQVFYMTFLSSTSDEFQFLDLIGVAVGAFKSNSYLTVHSQRRASRATNYPHSSWSVSKISPARLAVSPASM